MVYPKRENMLTKSIMLSVETSSRIGSVAIGIEEKILDSETFTAGARHGVELLPAVDRLCRRAEIKPDTIELVSISSGPGSFTGLRVGFTFARMIAQVTQAKITSVCSLDVIVENLRQKLAEVTESVFVAPILDAKRGQVYTAGYVWDKGTFLRVANPAVMTPKELCDKMKRPLWIVGEGIPYHRDAFSSLDGIEFMDEMFWRPKAENVYRLGMELARQNQFVPYDQLIPSYIRLPEAEEKYLLAREGKC
jgi:tRNA threonylcarbamoyladenosine biosynthesis protein TsaB